MRWVVPVLAVFFVFAAGLGNAQQAPRRVALVIANSTYAAAGSLANPASDARLVSTALRNAGFQTINMKTNLSAAAFRDALRSFRTQAAGAQVALVYYAGHGIEANNRNWLIPIDAQLTSELDLVDEAIDLDRVMADVSGADLRVVILDACRNNPFGRSWRSNTRAYSRGLGNVEADDVLVIFAAAPGQVASDGSGQANSPFATALARRLVQPGLPVQVLGNVVRDDVLRATQNQQRPFVSASMTGELFYLVPRAVPSVSVTEPEVERQLREARDRIAVLEASQKGPASVSSQVSQSRPPFQSEGAWTQPVSTTATYRPGQEIPKDCSACPQLVYVPGGRFTMGSPSSEAGRDSDEGPQRTVTIRHLLVGKFEITFNEWDACVADGGCRGYRPPDREWGRGLQPVINVSWNDAKAYVEWLSQRVGKHYRLLTEAEWEYAARAGATGPYLWGSDPNGGCAYGNGSDLSAYREDSALTTSSCDDGFGRRTAPVGRYRANAFGLYDISGNVREWVEDCYAVSYSNLAADGSAADVEDCSIRVSRGGSWVSIPLLLRSAFRGSGTPVFRSSYLGFRVARAI
jgi:formylglycine-generating enzyme required for sulfatase activity